jgi:DNA-binding SARP family transcriptional activator/tetratricopeptide (TPR) repeat protein/GTPase SAR1 family protein
VAPLHYLRCMGQPGLFAPDGTPVRLKSSKNLALLVFLAVEPRTPHRRDRLADLLWPDVPIMDARHSLVTAMSYIRGKLEPGAFQTTREYVRFTAELDLDLAHLSTGRVLATEFEPALELAGFLDEFEVPGVPAFDHWRDQQRARWWPDIETALIAQMDQCRRMGDFRQIARLAGQVLAVNEISEAAIRAQMEALAFSGDRLGALRIFETWKRSLHDQLQAVPSDLIEAIAARLRRGGLETSTHSALPKVPTEQWRDRPFIGRTREYRLLYEAWERTARCESSHILILGESGIGKSTLIQRLVTGASLEGAVSARVQCYEPEREIPYAAVGALAQGLLDRPGASGTPPQALADLAQTVPAVRERFPSLPSPIDLHGESFRIRLTDAVHQLILAVAEESPLILVVDDLHIVDDASAAVVHLLVRRLESNPVMFLLAARPQSSGESPNVARLREIHQRIRVQSLDLPPMSAEEAGEMLDSLVTEEGPSPSKAVRDAMLRAAGGYPMALELFVADWLANGERSLALSLPAMREELGSRPAPEDAYRLSLERIQEGLDAPTRNVLKLAAILGRRLDDVTMYRIVDLGLAGTAEAMERLRSLRLLRETDGRLEFVNEMIRGNAYLGIPASLRTALHGEVVQRLLANERAGRRGPGLEIAWHLIRAGRRDEATPYLLRGAQEAMRGGAPHEAERGLATAMDHLREPERSEALVLLGEALQEQGRDAESIAILEQVSAEAPMELTIRRNVLVLIAQRFLTPRSPEEQAEAIRQILEEGQRATRLNTRLRSLWLAALYYREVNEPALLSLIRTFLDRESPDCWSIDDYAEYCLARALLLYHSRDRESSLRALSEIITEMEASGIANSVFLSIILGINALHCALGNYDLALAAGLRGMELARRLGDENRLRTFAANIALCHCRLGNFREQLTWASTAATESNHACDFVLSLEAAFLAAMGHALLDQPAAALEALGTVPEAQLKSLTPWTRQTWYLHVADVMQVLGRGREALAAARMATTGDLDHLLLEGVAGPYARWKARLASLSPEKVPETIQEIKQLRDTRERLDRIDDLEALNAKVWLESTTGKLDEKERQEMWQLVGRMPPGVTTQLEKLGMLRGAF